MYLTPKVGLTEIVKYIIISLFLKLNTLFISFKLVTNKKSVFLFCKIKIFKFYGGNFTLPMSVTIERIILIKSFKLVHKCTTNFPVLLDIFKKVSITPSQNTSEISCNSEGIFNNFKKILMFGYTKSYLSFQ